MAADPAPLGLKNYRLLGRTGLRVSPLCLGAMTFGNTEGWGADEAESRRILDRYVDAGGNFVDTANVYTGGQSEEMLGQFLSASSSRDRIALATKFSITTRPGDPNAGGNGRKNIYQSIDASLRRLKTDYIDLYWLHYWDTLTPIEEVVDTLDDLVRCGKVRYIGFSDVPAWYMARAQTYAELRGKARVAAMQLEYSLLDRNIENEHVVAAQELGVGICPWGPLGSGLLTGKYRRGQDREANAGKGRIATDARYGRQLTDRNFDIVEALVGIAEEIGRSPSQVALNWITHRPGVAATVIGATSQRQLEENLLALDFTIPAELAARLEQASRSEPVHLYDFFKAPFGDALRGARITR
jgi:aryl-alcohol dehydrogenase-like predicted oxidoreductase